jgi:dolichyl-phosphate-mannose--protein O-mannosyl transferase
VQKEITGAIVSSVHYERDECQPFARRWMKQLHDIRGDTSPVGSVRFGLVRFGCVLMTAVAAIAVCMKSTEPTGCAARLTA